MTFLIESIPFLDVLPSLDALPARTVAWKISTKSKERLAANAQAGKRHKPISVAVANSIPSPSPSSEPVQIAAAKTATGQLGLILDYILINSTQTNFTFIGTKTYYATNYV